MQDLFIGTISNESVELLTVESVVHRPASWELVRNAISQAPTPRPTESECTIQQNQGIPVHVNYEMLWDYSNAPSIDT